MHFYIKYCLSIHEGLELNDVRCKLYWRPGIEWRYTFKSKKIWEEHDAIYFISITSVFYKNYKKIAQRCVIQEKYS